MGDKTLLLADSLHINERNFPSLLAFCSARGVDIVRASNSLLPINAFGDYSAYRGALTPWRNSLESLTPLEISTLDYHGVRLFDAIRAELLSFVMAKPSWHGDHLPTRRDDLIDRFFRQSKDELLDCLAAACAWIDFWNKTLRETPRLAWVGVFSGSLLYARTLLEVTRFSVGRCLVMESFFTGHHYYLEERHSPIANRSDIAKRTVYRSLALPEDRTVYETRRNVVLAKIAAMQNKNVKQPGATGARLFDNGRPTVLMLGQVLNDFSVLEFDNLGLCSLQVYRDTISQILAQTDCNVVFKAHPWERKKPNLSHAPTREALEAQFGDDPRVAIVEDHSLADLFAEADCVHCICSQSGIEAALAGFKPVQVGRAFWGERGFSHDLNFRDSEGLARVLADPTSWRLKLDGYEDLHEWLVKVVAGWMVEETPGAAADTRLKAVLHEIAGRTPTKAATPVALGATTQSAQRVSMLESGGSDAAAVELRVRTDSRGRTNFQRKLNKLMRRPDEFFRDAQNDAVRKVGLFLIGR